MVAGSKVAHSVTDTESRALAALLFVSGVLALVYEVVWQREFALVLGSAAPATSAVLAAYLGGLGLGSWLVGKTAARFARPLRVYAGLEVLIGVGALLVAPVLAAIAHVSPWLSEVGGSSASGAWVARVVLAWLAILLPTFCMGGTVPLIAGALDPAKRNLGVSAGWLYVANTAGAAVGALCVPFFLLPWLGMRRMVTCAAAVNVGIGVVAWWLDRRRSSQRTVAAPWEGGLPEGNLREDGGELATGAAGFFSGLVTFALQVLWNRAFAQVHENSMYSFAWIVVLVVLGLALGAAAASEMLRRGISARGIVVVGWLAAGVVVVAGPWILYAGTDGLNYLPVAAGEASATWTALWVAGTVVWLPMLLMGVAMPALMQRAGAQHGGAGQVLGRLLGLNVLGSVLGALAGGFFLPVWLGTWNAIIGLGVMLFAAGAIAGLGRWKASRRARLGGQIGVLVVAVVSLFPVRSLDLAMVRVDTTAGERLLWAEEGPHGITAVVERPGSRRIKLNNHYGLGGTASTGDERMQTHLPLLLHPSPRSVAHLGLGTGISAGAAWHHPAVEVLTVVELVPDVVEAARVFFAEANQGVLTHPATRTVEDDARHHLRTSGAQYDVIIGDLVVPWRQGEGALYTLQHFQAAKDALKPGGLFCQWVPLFQVSEDEFEILARTFLSVFPDVQVWRGDFSPTQPALALVGGAGEASMAQIGSRVQAMRVDSDNGHLRHRGAVLMYWVGRLDAGDLRRGETRINSEDRPWLELIGPRAHAGHRADNLFVGRGFQRWVEGMQKRALVSAGSSDGDERGWMRAGSVFARMLLALEEGAEGEATAAQRELRELMAPELYAEFFPSDGR